MLSQGGGTVSQRTSPVAATATMDDRLVFWQGHQKICARMPLAQRGETVARLCKRVPRLDAVVRVHRAEHDAARFGSARLYTHVLDVLEDEMVTMIQQKHTDATPESINAVTVDLLATVENNVLLAGRADTLAVHYGLFRHVVGIGGAPSIRWLWGTVLALVWCIGAAATVDEFGVVARCIHQHVGDREFRLFGAVLLTLHRLFGILPAAVHDSLAAYLAA